MSKTYIAHEANGYYAKDVKVTVDSRLRYAPYSQAGWRDRLDDFGGLAREMYSYSSLIFTAHYDGTTLCEISTHGAAAAIDYSRTTSAQVTKAMRELGLTDRVIAALKRFFADGGGTAVSLVRGDWVDASTGEIIA